MTEENKSKLVSLDDKRTAKQEVLKREYERVLFDKILGCYTVVEKLGIKPIEIIDISKSGISFVTTGLDALYETGEEVDMRLYFSNDTYLPAKLFVRRARKIKKTFHTEWEYGCAFDTTLGSYEAIKKFADFIFAYSQNAKKDEGSSNILHF